MTRNKVNIYIFNFTPEPYSICVFHFQSSHQAAQINPLPRPPVGRDEFKLRGLFSPLQNVWINGAASASSNKSIKIDKNAVNCVLLGNVGLLFWKKNILFYLIFFSGHGSGCCKYCQIVPWFDGTQNNACEKLPRLCLVDGSKAKRCYGSQYVHCAKGTIWYTTFALRDISYCIFSGLEY